MNLVDRVRATGYLGNSDYKDRMACPVIVRMDAWDEWREARESEKEELDRLSAAFSHRPVEHLGLVASVHFVETGYRSSTI